MPSSVIFIHVGWMVEYAGQALHDPTLGGFKYLAKHQHGIEAWNFKPFRNRLYGGIPGGASIKIDRLGALSTDEEVHGVTVIWVAKNPSNRKRYVVGWYQDATVARTKSSVDREERKVGYQIEAPTRGAKLLPPDQRTFLVPTGSGGMGTASMWYGSPSFNRKALKYVEAGGAASGKRKSLARAARQPDPDLRRLVEQAAVQHATTYYESQEGGSRKVESVEPDRVGWDLTVTSEGMELYVEVKGLSGAVPVVELTPNEYKNMQLHRQKYVVYIVTSALIKKGMQSIVFYYDADASDASPDQSQGIWATHDGRRLVIQPVQAARLSVA